MSAGAVSRRMSWSMPSSMPKRSSSRVRPPIATAIMAKTRATLIHGDPGAQVCTNHSAIAAASKPHAVLTFMAARPATGPVRSATSNNSPKNTVTRGTRPRVCRLVPAGRASLGRFVRVSRLESAVTMRGARPRFGRQVGRCIPQSSQHSLLWRRGVCGASLIERPAIRMGPSLLRKTR
jgi:hypothetical protein